jgi:hypothetical protein
LPQRAVPHTGPRPSSLFRLAPKRIDQARSLPDPATVKGIVTVFLVALFEILCGAVVGAASVGRDRADGDGGRH